MLVEREVLVQDIYLNLHLLQNPRLNLHFLFWPLYVGNLHVLNAEQRGIPLLNARRRVKLSI